MILLVKNFPAGARVNQSSLWSSGGVMISDPKKKFCISPTSTWTALLSINWSAFVPKSWERMFWNGWCTWWSEWRSSLGSVKLLLNLVHFAVEKVETSQFEVWSELERFNQTKRKLFSSTGQRESPSEHCRLRWMKRWVQSEAVREHETEAYTKWMWMGQVQNRTSR